MKFIILLGIIVLIVATAAARTETLVSGNPKCPNLEGKFTPGETPNFVLNYYDVITFHVGPFADGNTITFHAVDVNAGTVGSWASTFGIDAIYMKGGNGAWEYGYVPMAVSDNVPMHTPVNPSHHYAGISHISVCYRSGLRLTAVGQVVATYDNVTTWHVGLGPEPACPTGYIDSPSVITLPITVTHTESMGNVRASGSFTVYNPASASTATMSQVTAAIATMSLPATCGSMTLAPHATTTCSFSGPVLPASTIPGYMFYATVTTPIHSSVSGGALQEPVTWTATPVNSGLTVTVTGADAIPHPYTWHASDTSPHAPITVSVVPEAYNTSTFLFTVSAVDSHGSVFGATAAVCVYVVPPVPGQDGCVFPLEFWRENFMNWVDNLLFGVVSELAILQTPATSGTLGDALQQYVTAMLNAEYQDVIPPTVPPSIVSSLQALVTTGAPFSTPFVAPSIENLRSFNAGTYPGGPIACMGMIHIG
jgi:hypothetical protein